MRFYTLNIRLWDAQKKISNIREFCILTGADITESRKAVESMKAVESIDTSGFFVIIISAERLGNYYAWRSLSGEDTCLSLEIVDEYMPGTAPTIYS